MPSLRQIEVAAAAGEQIALKVAPGAVRAAEGAVARGLSLVGLTAEEHVAVRTIRPAWDEGLKLKSLAEPATAKGKSWTQIYKEAFPPEESNSIYSIRQRVANHGSLFYETRGTDGRVLTFSLFDRLGVMPINGEMSPLYFNAYNATRNGYRGMGLGSKHMGGALTKLFEKHPTAVVPFEIDHVGLKTLPTLNEVQTALRSGHYSQLGALNPNIKLTPEAMRTNLERLQFYQRLGDRTGFPARVANMEYQMPNLEDLAAKPIPAHFMYFSKGPLPESSLADVVRSVFTSPTGYDLPPTHPVIAPVLQTIGKTAIAAKL
jgi:hypothetical protein